MIELKSDAKKEYVYITNGHYPQYLFLSVNGQLYLNKWKMFWHLGN